MTKALQPTKISSTLLMLVALIGLHLVIPSVAHAQTRAWSGVCVGTGAASDVATIQGLQCLIANLLSIFITLIGMAGFVMLVVSSIRYLVSGGNTKGIETARKTIYHVILGLIIALSAFIVLNLLSAFTGVSILRNFSLPGSDSDFTSF